MREEFVMFEDDSLTPEEIIKYADPEEEVTEYEIRRDPKNGLLYAYRDEDENDEEKGEIAMKTDYISGDKIIEATDVMKSETEKRLAEYENRLRSL